VYTLTRSPDDAIAATIAEESMPPLRKLPRGTSLTIWRRIEAPTVSATRSRHSAAGRSSGSNRRSQYESTETPCRSTHAK